MARRIYNILSAVAEDVDIFRILLTESRGLDREIDEVLFRINRIMISHIETEIAFAQRLKVIRPHRPRAGAHLVAATVLLVIITHFIESEPPDTGQLSEELADLIVNGIKPGQQ